MFSIVMPMDAGRFEQFTKTKRMYDSFPQVKEFVMPTRTYDEMYPYMKKHGLLKDVRLIKYTIDTPFNPSRALNIGVKESKYQNLIITGPETIPTTQILEQLSECDGQNIMCQCFDEDVNGNLTSMVNKQHKNWSPQPYFLAMFQKANIEAINGWDEEFMNGHAWEDDDFGARWVRAGLPFEIREDIRAVHQYHPRSENAPGGDARNQALFHQNNQNNVIRPANGLVKE